VKCECGKELPDAAVKDDDPFCSRACACAHFGTERPQQPHVTAYSGAMRMLQPSEAKTPTNKQRARVGIDRLARERLGLRQR
jgi:hypothetical protein